MVKYEVTDPKTIDKLNEHGITNDPGTKKLKKEDVIDIGVMDAQYVPLENDKLKNVISEKEEDNKGILTPIKDQVAYEPTLHGLDFKSESLRLRLSLAEIIKNLVKVNETRKTRESNLNQKWHVDHAGMSTGSMVEHTNANIKLEPIEISDMIKSFEERNSKNIESEYKYFEREINAIDDKSSAKKFKHVMGTALDMAMKDGVAVEIIGNKATESGVESFAKVSRHNSGSYDSKSIVGVIPAVNAALTKKEKLSHSFKEVDRAIKAGSTIITEPSNQYVVAVMDAYGLAATTSNKMVNKALESQVNPDIPSDTFKSEASKFTMNNYMVDHGYTGKLQNGVVVYTKLDIGYNDKIKNQNDLFAIFEEFRTKKFEEGC